MRRQQTPVFRPPAPRNHIRSWKTSACAFPQTPPCPPSGRRSRTWNETGGARTGPFGKSGFVGTVHGFLGHHGNRHGLRGNDRCCLDGFLDQVSGRHDARHQAGAFSFVGIHHASGQAHVQMALDLPTNRGQPLGASGARHGTEIDLGLAELCRISRQDEVAHHRHLAAATERIASHGGNHRLAATGDPSPTCR